MQSVTTIDNFRSLLALSSLDKRAKNIDCDCFRAVQEQLAETTQIYYHAHANLQDMFDLISEAA